jgi:hypothetical protein
MVDRYGIHVTGVLAIDKMMRANAASGNATQGDGHAGNLLEDKSLGEDKRGNQSLRYMRKRIEAPITVGVCVWLVGRYL